MNGCEICSTTIENPCSSCNVPLCPIHNQHANHSLNCKFTPFYEKIYLFFERKYWFYAHKYFNKYRPIPPGVGFDKVLLSIDDKGEKSDE